VKIFIKFPYTRLKFLAYESFAQPSNCLGLLWFWFYASCVCVLWFVNHLKQFLIVICAKQRPLSASSTTLNRKSEKERERMREKEIDKLEWLHSFRWRHFWDASRGCDVARNFHRMARPACRRFEPTAGRDL